MILLGLLFFFKLPNGIFDYLPVIAGFVFSSGAVFIQGLIIWWQNVTFLIRKASVVIFLGLCAAYAEHTGLIQHLFISLMRRPPCYDKRFTFEVIEFVFLVLPAS